MKHSKLFRKYADKIKTSTLSESDILALRMALNSRRRTTLQDSEKRGLIDMIADHAPRVSPEQSEKGRAWLMNQWKTPKGRERKNNPFGYRETYVLENFDHFTFSGLYDVGRNGFAEYLPIYTVHATDSSTFQYVVGCWQSGQGIRIIG